MTDRSRRTAPKGASAGRGASPARRRSTGRGATSTSRGRPASHRGRRIAVGLVVSAVLVVFLLVAVFPTRTWLAQRDETEAREQDLARIRSEQEAYEDRIEELDDPEEIEQLAREEHGLVQPGEEAFRVFPTAVAPVDLPETWPFTGASDWLNR